MKNISFLIILFCFILNSCVQKTFTKTVVYNLTVKNIKDIQSAGIRGNDKPLNWNEDLKMEVIKADTLYQTIVTYKTGYKFTEVKFVVNGDFEFQNNPNRRVAFNDKDTTYYQAEFNSPK